MDYISDGQILRLLLNKLLIEREQYDDRFGKHSSSDT
jgi:hypothetical protein